MTIDTTKAMNYSWMSQAAYLDLAAVLSGDADGLVAHLKSSSINGDNNNNRGQTTIIYHPQGRLRFLQCLRGSGQLRLI